MIDTKTQYEIAIAALLHDIGKFKQRAYCGDESKLSNEVKNMEEQLLPKDSKSGFCTHRHALWTYSAILDDIAPIIRSNDSLYQLIDIEKIARWSAEHHNPSDDSRIIERADKISAGNDRAYSDEKYERGKYLRTPLRSIFSKLGNDTNNGNTVGRSEYAYSLESLTDDEALFPEKDKEINSKEYNNLYSEFINSLYYALKDIHSYEHLLLKLKDLLYQYTWCIPSATNDYLNDISLYDHSITTMSIALALANNNGGEMVRVCSFCVSGIQSFIFQSKYASFPNAARIFRGRSFIVSAFTTAMKNIICDRLGIIPFVDVLDAGGKMTLILPSSTDATKLEKIQEECEKFLLEKYYGTLAITMDFSTVTELDNLGQGKFLDFYNAEGKKLAKQKNRKFQYALKSMDPIIESELGKSVCTACGNHSMDDDAEICDVCSEEAMLGSRISKKQYIVFSTKHGQCEFLPNSFLSIVDDVRFSFDSDNYIFSLSEKDETYPIWRLNNYVPENMDFSDIARKSVDANGYGKPFLAYIKIDVDSLGSLISEGLPKEEYSISRFTTLSRSLHYFFNIHIYRMLESDFPNTYTVLSGGDDVFLITPWNKALYLINRINEDFKRFCSNNPKIHFSAGVYIAHAKEPFAFANDKVNRELEYNAKEFECEGKVVKNAISYFGTAFSLNRLPAFIKDYEELCSYIRVGSDESKPITMGFLYRLYTYASDSLASSEMVARRYGVYSKLHYDIARNLQSPKDEYNAIYTSAIRFILAKFDQYKSQDDLKRFKALLRDAMYTYRKTNVEDDR